MILHPIDSFDNKLDFWEEFPSFKAHRVLGNFWKNNKSKFPKESSMFMWCLALCYDKKSALYSQPEYDKWEAASEATFGDEKFLLNLSEDPAKCKKLVMPLGCTLHILKDSFEKSIDTPLGLSLRRLEEKLTERTDFITSTSYTMDGYETKNGRTVPTKGTADQLDKMFAQTDKITSIIQTAMDKLKSSSAMTSTKGDQKESLSDGDKTF